MAIFTQKERIEKMRSFSELDSSVEMTSPSLWLAIIGGALLIAALIVWMMIGRIPKLITVQGVYRGNGQCVCFADLGNGKEIKKNTEVKICPATVTSEEYGNIVARVSEVDDYITESEEAEQVLESAALASYFLREPACYFICSMEEDDGSVSGFKWTSDKGNRVELKDGTLVTARVSLGATRPIAMILPAMDDVLDSL